MTSSSTAGHNPADAQQAPYLTSPTIPVSSFEDMPIQERRPVRSSWLTTCGLIVSLTQRAAAARRAARTSELRLRGNTVKRDTRTRIWRTRVRQLLEHGSFSRSFAVLAGGTVAGQLVALAASPVITRLYTPHEFGVLAVYVSLLGVVGVAANLRYEIAIPIPADRRVAANLFGAAIAAALLIPTAVLAASFVLGDEVSALLGMSELADYMWLLALGTCALGLYQALNYWALRHRDFRRIAQTKLTQGFGSALVQILGGVLNAGPLGLIVGQLVGQAAGVGTLALRTLRRDAQDLAQIDPRGVRDAARTYRNFPLISSWSAIGNALGLRLPALLMVGFYGTAVGGQFSLGIRILATPLSIISLSLSQVYLSRLAELRNESPTGMGHLFDSMTRNLLVASVPVLAAGALAPWLFPVIFGTQWHQAGLFVQASMTTFAAQLVVVPVSQTLNILERQDLQLAWDMGRLIAVAASMWVAWASGLSPMGTVLVYAAVSTVAYAALFIVTRQGIIHASLGATHE